MEDIIASHDLMLNNVTPRVVVEKAPEDKAAWRKLGACFTRLKATCAKTGTCRAEAEWFQRSLY
eukprot:4067400-Lingulodinium_polyedra.AAC.1